MEYDKSYAIFNSSNNASTELNETDNLIHEANRLQLNTYQAFVSNLMNPRSDLRSLLLMHMTGTGKTISALSTATEYVRQYIPHSVDQSVSTIVVLGFTKDIFKKELLRHPEFSFVNFDEALELKELEQQMHNSDAITEEYNTKRKNYQRRLFRRDVRGIYQFYGYRQFANRVINMNDLQEMIQKENNKEASEETIDSKIVLKWIEEGKVRINTNFIKSLSHSFFICDEVHNLYKNNNINTYGIAIKLTFDYFFKTLKPNDIDHGSVKSLLLSATPLTSSALEIIPIVNLLTGDELQYEDLFKTREGVEELTIAGSSKLRHILSGRISYIMDDNPKEYPSSAFAGTKLHGVDYLKFIRTTPSGHQLSCFNHWGERVHAIDERGSNMVKDIAFPGTKEYPNGVVFSKNISDLADISPSIAVRKASSGFLSSNIFKKKELVKYSSKYTKLVDMCLQMKGKDDGKMFIYHPFVQGSGTELIISVLIANGFVFDGDNVVETSICMNCNDTYSSHKKDHEFVPVRFTYITGNLNKPTISSRLAAFNSEQNKFGERIKIIVGSKAMRESHTLVACRHVVITHEPSSISELIQIVGRAVRKHVHAILPKDMRSVTIHILTTDVSAIKELHNDITANEELSYRLKVLQYKQIDRVERIMYDTSVDYLINFRFKLRETPRLLGESFPLDQPRFAKYQKNMTKAYTDIRNGVSPIGIHTNRFNVFYFEGEVKTVSLIIKRILLDYQPVITIKQVMEAVRAPPFHVEYNTQLISNEAIAVSINNIVFEYYDLRVISPPDQTTLVDSLYDQTSTIVDSDNVQFKILCIGHPLCLDSVLLKRSIISIVENDKSIIDSYRKMYAKTLNAPVDLQSLADNWDEAIDIDDIILELSHVPVDDYTSQLNKYTNHTNQRIVEWVIENAVGYAAFKENTPNLKLVKQLIDFYAVKRLIIRVSSLVNTRLYPKFKPFNVDTGSPWYSTNAKPSLASMPVGHMIGNTVRVFDLKDRSWLELGSIGDGVQDKYPYGFYIYEDKAKDNLNVVLKVKFENNKKTGITMIFLQKSQIKEIASKINANIANLTSKIEMIDSIERVAIALQAKIYPKRVYYRLIDM